MIPIDKSQETIKKCSICAFFLLKKRNYVIVMSRFLDKKGKLSMSDMSDRGESPLFTILVPALVVIVFSIIVGTVAMSFSHQRLTTAILPQNAAYASTVGEDSDEPAQTPAKENKSLTFNRKFFSSY